MIKKWLRIDKIEAENKRLKHVVNAFDDKLNELDKLATLDADEGVRGPCTIILSGVFRGRG